MQTTDTNTKPELPQITFEEEARHVTAWQQSLREIGAHDATKNDIQFIYYYVSKAVRLPDGRRLIDLPLSPAFRHYADAKTAHAKLVNDHPGASLSIVRTMARDPGPDWQWEEYHAVIEQERAAANA
jgi:hypothetical protein